MSEDRVQLRVGSRGERSAGEIINFLDAIERSHDGLLGFFILFDRDARGLNASHSTTPDPRYAVELLRGKRERYERMNYSDEELAQIFSLEPPPRLMRLLLEPGDQLEVVKINVASPGLWTFLGALNPLTFINDFLDRKHEQQKDRDYRNSAESDRLRLENRRLELENELLDNRVVRERLAVAQALGITPEEQRELLNRLAIRPLLELDRIADRGMAFPGDALSEVQELEVAELVRSGNTPRDLPPSIN